jgi:hypothetical protein
MNLSISPFPRRFLPFAIQASGMREMPVTKVYEARYIDPEQLRSMLTRLFPGKWAAEVCGPADCRGVLALTLCASQARLGRWMITTPQALTKVSRKSFQTCPIPYLTQTLSFRRRLMRALRGID